MAVRMRKSSTPRDGRRRVVLVGSFSDLTPRLARLLIAPTQYAIVICEVFRRAEDPICPGCVLSIGMKITDAFHLGDQELTTALRRLA